MLPVQLRPINHISDVREATLSQPMTDRTTKPLMDRVEPVCFMLYCPDKICFSGNKEDYTFKFVPVVRALDEVYKEDNDNKILYKHAFEGDENVTVEGTTSPPLYIG
jgi:hypothetical protein